jgi:imidazoleglycerol phosphate dehydratase HisB
MTASFAVKNIACVNEAKPGVPILTGIGYLDHMIDQWNSHAQVGVGLEVFDIVETSPGKKKLASENLSIDEHADRNQFASGNQVELCTAVGHALGIELKKVLLSTKDTSPRRSRFCCPLDEALVECLISSSNDAAVKVNNDDDYLVKYSLAPYGIYPRNVGRTQIGKLETVAIESFWKALATSAGITISLEKIRGDNAHHIGRCSILQIETANILFTLFILLTRCTFRHNMILMSFFFSQLKAPSRPFPEHCEFIWILHAYGNKEAPTTWQVLL